MVKATDYYNVSPRDPSNNALIKIHAMELAVQAYSGNNAGEPALVVFKNILALRDKIYIELLEYVS